jgi:type I restriction enzyme, S subunit
VNDMAPREAPAGWCIATLGEVASIVAGVGFPTHLQGLTDEEVPVYKVGDVSLAWQERRVRLEASPNTVSVETARRLAARLVPAGATVFAKIGAAIALNRRAITSRPCLVDNNVMAAIPDEDVLDQRFLFYASSAESVGEPIWLR